MKIALITAVIVEFVSILILFILHIRLRRFTSETEARLVSAIARKSRELRHGIDDIYGGVAEITGEITNKLSDLQEKYEAAEEMIHQVTRSAEEAAATEKKMQDGIDAILNYNSQIRFDSDIC